MLNSVELCAGAGGQALGLEQAGFDHQALVEIDDKCCETLRLNRPSWNVHEEDLKKFNGKPYKGTDLLAGGLPCPPFSIAGKQLGENDERNLFPDGINIIDEIRPRAVMFENVKGILSASFEDFRDRFSMQLKKLGYTSDWKLLKASDYGVSQLRPRVVLVAVKSDYSEKFEWPDIVQSKPPSVGELLFDLMSENGWHGAKVWRDNANNIAPTIVGGSKKHGGPDLGPTRAKQAWLTLGVNGKTIADDLPEKDFDGVPRLTLRMVARLQGFPDKWEFSGRKTAAYRQVGNAFPPPVAKAVGNKIAEAIYSQNLYQVVA